MVISMARPRAGYRKAEKKLAKLNVFQVLGIAIERGIILKASGSV
jgi:hypothetical protein